MKWLGIVLGLFIIVFFELAIERSYVFWSPFLFLLWLCISFWYLTFFERMFLGILFGVLLDSTHVFPFGTHVFIIIIACWLTDMLQYFFTNIDSAFTQVISVALVVLATSSLVYPAAYGIGRMGGVNLVWSTTAEVYAILQGLVWSLFGTAFFIRVLFYIKKKMLS